MRRSISFVLLFALLTPAGLACPPHEDLVERVTNADRNAITAIRSGGRWWAEAAEPGPALTEREWGDGETKDVEGTVFLWSRSTTRPSRWWSLADKQTHDELEGAVAPGPADEIVGELVFKDVPADVLSAVPARYAGWGVNRTTRIKRQGVELFAVELSNGQSTHPSQDRWIGLEITAAGQLMRPYAVVPRKGKFEDN
jgi:hypothetical protein